jgi:phospholipase/carboxylesterase
MARAAIIPVCLVVACGLTASCRPGGPIVTRITARPATPTVAIEPGEHRLGLSGPTTRRDGILYVPRSARSRALPLLVLLHGGGGRANYFRFTFPLAEEFAVVILTLDSRDNTWDGIDSSYGPDVAFLDTALQYTFARVAIDPHRVALGGISDGASYALSLGMANGDLFTHLVAVSPGFIAPPSPPVGRPLIFVAHGTRDNVYSVDGTRRHIVPRLKQSGYDVTYSEFDGPHSMLPATTREALEWLRH